MKITLRSFANIRDVVGAKELPVDLGPKATLSDLFEFLEKEYGANFDRQVRDQISGKLVPFLILINDKTYRSISDMGTGLNESDVVTIMIPFDGG
jgi:molybdopterin converting factor small subunit